MPFFELKTPRDMLNKARRERDRLREGPFDVDNLFNFFVSAWHVQDYIRKSGAVPQHALDGFLNDPSLAACRDLCNQGKHVTLSHHDDPHHYEMSGAIGGAPIGAMAIGAGTEWHVQTEDGSFEVQWLADQVLRRWEEFLQKHGL